MMRKLGSYLRMVLTFVKVLWGMGDTMTEEMLLPEQPGRER